MHASTIFSNGSPLPAPRIGDWGIALGVGGGLHGCGGLGGPPKREIKRGDERAANRFECVRSRLGGRMIAPIGGGLRLAQAAGRQGAATPAARPQAPPPAIACMVVGVAGALGGTHTGVHSGGSAACVQLTYIRAQQYRPKSNAAFCTQTSYQS